MLKIEPNSTIAQYKANMEQCECGMPGFRTSGLKCAEIMKQCVSGHKVEPVMYWEVWVLLHYLLWCIDITKQSLWHLHNCVGKTACIFMPTHMLSLVLTNSIECLGSQLCIWHNTMLNGLQKNRLAPCISTVYWTTHQLAHKNMMNNNRYNCFGTQHHDTKPVDAYINRGMKEKPFHFFQEHQTTPKMFSVTIYCNT